MKVLSILSFSMSRGLEYSFKNIHYNQNSRFQKTHNILFKDTFKLYVVKIKQTIKQIIFTFFLTNT